MKTCEYRIFFEGCNPNSGFHKHYAVSSMKEITDSFEELQSHNALSQYIINGVLNEYRKLHIKES